MLLSTGCENQKGIVAEGDTKSTEPSIDSAALIRNDKEESDDHMFIIKTEILCDSIYGKDYKVSLSQFSDKKSYYDAVYNSVFKFSINTGSVYKELFIDSVQSHFCQIKFKDFNNDSVKDILVENISDARSNTTF
jgi:hypothetical protein